MLHRAFLAMSLLCWSSAAWPASVVDAIGRTVQVSEIRRLDPDILVFSDPAMHAARLHAVLAGVRPPPP